MISICNKIPFKVTAKRKGIPRNARENASLSSSVAALRLARVFLNRPSTSLRTPSE